MLAGFREGRDLEEIRAALHEKGTEVSRRSLDRWHSDWRAEERLMEFARETGMAIAAADVGRVAVGDMRRIAAEQLAARVVLIPDWRLQRERILLGDVRAFLARPTAARAFVAQTQVLMMLFEHELASYHNIAKKIRRGTRERNRNGASSGEEARLQQTLA